MADMLRLTGDPNSGQGTINWNVVQDGGTWIAVCPQLNVSTVGDTFGELVESINDILTHFFQDLAKCGELDQFLRDRGWRLERIPVAGHEDQFDVPFDIRRTNRELHAAAG